VNVPTCDLSGCKHGNRLALVELNSVTLLLGIEANLMGEDVPPTACQSGIRHLHQPYGRRYRKGVQQRRLARPIVTHQQGKLWMQLERLLLKALEVLNFDFVNSHGGSAVIVAYLSQ